MRNLSMHSAKKKIMKKKSQMTANGESSVFDDSSEDRSRKSFKSNLSSSITRTMSRKNPLKVSNYDQNSHKSKFHKRINQYVISKVLGCGAQSQVLLGQHKETKQKYAIKAIKQRNQSICSAGGINDTNDKIVSELEVLRNLSHKNIVKLHEFIQHPKKKKFYLVMDHLPGGTIMDALEASGVGLPVPKVREYFRQLISAVHYCHEVKNIVHRDIKPENCLLDAKNQLILCDFGVSQFF